MGELLKPEESVGEKSSGGGNGQSEEGEFESKNQFGLTAMFWATFLVGIGLAYLERLDSPDIIIDGLIAIAIGLVFGSILGKLTGHTMDAMFWSTLISAFGYISMAGDPIYESFHRLTWAIVGAVSGGISASLFLNRPWLNGIASGIGAGIVMGVYYSLARGTGGGADLTMDLYAAPVVGILVACLIQAIVWIEKQQKMPRLMTATWLMAAVILGNVFAR